VRLLFLLWSGATQQPRDIAGYGLIRRTPVMGDRLRQALHFDFDIPFLNRNAPKPVIKTLAMIMARILMIFQAFRMCLSLLWSLA
jgi:hypothetical protein